MNKKFWAPLHVSTTVEKCKEPSRLSPATKNVRLMPKNDDLSFNSPLGPEQRDHEACEKLRNIDHLAADDGVCGWFEMAEVRTRYLYDITHVFRYFHQSGRSYGRSFSLAHPGQALRAMAANRLCFRRLANRTGSPPRLPR
jgi:hypothetical protein